MKKLTLFTILLLSGCVSFTEQDKLFFVQHAIDVGQTYQISRSDCHWEDNGITSGIIGAHPGEGEVILWGIGSTLVYFAAKDHVPSWVKNVFLSTQGMTINNNMRIGLSVGTSSCLHYDNKLQGGNPWS